MCVTNVMESSGTRITFASMSLMKQIASWILIFTYSIGMVHGAIPHSHYVEMTDSRNAEPVADLNDGSETGLMELLIGLLSEPDFTDIEDLFVYSSSENTVLKSEAKAQFTAVLFALVILGTEAIELPVSFDRSVEHRYCCAYLQSSSRRGPPLLS